jgi:hypothetical protein
MQLEIPIGWFEAISILNCKGSLYQLAILIAGK